MSLRDLQSDARLADDAARQLSVARVAGFVRTMPAQVGDPAMEPRYQPSPLGMLIARRSRAHALAREERRISAPRAFAPAPPTARDQRPLAPRAAA